MDAERTYQIAREAQKEWSKLSVSERLHYFRTFRRLLADQVLELSSILQEITGKLLFEAITAEVLAVIHTIAYWEKHALRQLNPKRTPTPLLLFGRRSWIEFRPRGVVLVIAPWNYPLQLSLIPSLSALLAGNAVVLKPSEITSKLDPYLRDLFLQAQFPPGLVQTISGDGAVGAELVEAGPDLIFFTGSVATGRIIQKMAAPNLIPTILELGGKDAMIIMGDAPLGRAVQGALWGSFTNCGQVCLGTERILVHESIYDQFLEQFTKAVDQLTVGKMASLGQVQVVREQLEDALAKGASLVSGSAPVDWEAGSLHIKPSVVVDVTEDMVLAHTETFGPVVTVTRFSTDEEAILLANSNTYGLGASVWSGDYSRAKKLTGQLAAGNISINDSMITVANPYLPFGGIKASGLGSYRGADGLRAFCHQTAVMATRGKKNTELNWFPYNQEKEGLVLELIRTFYGSERKWLKLGKKALNRKRIQRRS